MIVEVGEYRYEWHERWAEIVDNDSGRSNGRTHGVQVTTGGEVVVFCQAEPSVLFFDAEGVLFRSWGNYPGAHGLTLTHEDGTDYLWLTDETSRDVVKTTLDGSVVLSLHMPPHPAYRAGGNYVPTWVAVNERRWGGNGDVWVADGYGSSLVHRFTALGESISSIDGTDGAGRFACPHGIFFDARGAAPQILVADRSNHRIQAFTPDGVFISSFADDVLVHPDCFSTHGQLLLVPELFGRVALLGADNQLIGYLGRNDAAPQLTGWPNLQPDQLEPGKFSSPHGGTFDEHGNITIVEWIIGGRITRLWACR